MSRAFFIPMIIGAALTTCAVMAVLMWNPRSWATKILRALLYVVFLYGGTFATIWVIVKVGV